MKKSTMLLAVVVSAANLTQALPGKEHQRLGELLLEMPPSKGGSKGMVPSKVKAVGDWMDNSTKKLGQHRISGLEGSPKVTPMNHRHYRHNPIRVAKALSGNRTVDPAVLNQARLHKIGDFSSGTTGVDGWGTPTEKQVKQAKKLISYVEKKHRLPRRLPKWVDESGSLLVDRAKSMRAAKKASEQVARSADDATRAGAEVVEQAGKASKCLKVAGKAAKIAGPLTLVVEGGIRGKMAYDTEQAYEQGVITQDERIVKHARNGGRMVGGAAGAAAGAWTGAALGGCTGPAAPVCVPVFAVVGGVAGGFGGDELGGRVAETVAVNRKKIAAKCKSIGNDIKIGWNDFKGDVVAFGTKSELAFSRLF